MGEKENLSMGCNQHECVESFAFRLGMTEQRPVDGRIDRSLPRVEIQIHPTTASCQAFDH